MDEQARMRVLAWLGYWRDQMPPDAVKSLQALLDELAAAATPPEDDLNEYQHLGLTVEQAKAIDAVPFDEMSPTGEMFEKTREAAARIAEQAWGELCGNEQAHSTRSNYGKTVAYRIRAMAQPTRWG